MVFNRIRIRIRNFIQHNMCYNNQYLIMIFYIICVLQGRPQDLGGGGARIFFSDLGNLHLAKRHAAHGKAMRIARGFGGMLPRENFLKRCNLVRFRVYFDQILSLFFSKKCHFLYKK